MFIYKLPTVDKLLLVCKSRDYVKNNPNLCHLLENPLLKDDTELAIQYNEYKAGKPDAGKKFVDYFFTHGPELDTNTLITWRDIIKNDSELNYYGQTLNITTVQKNKNKLLGDLFDCLQNPCQYLRPLSTSLGCIADSTSKYNIKNTAGNDSVITLIDIPEEMVNKIPKQLLGGMSQLTTMISEQMSDIANMIEKHDNASKEDPYVIQRAEMFGGDVLADIATRFGDCFRILEFQKRYNPYNREMNKSTADINGTVVYDANGNPRTISPNGNTIRTLSKAQVFSDNRRTQPLTKAQDIATYNVQDTDNAGFVPFWTTVYGAVLTANGIYYSDNPKNSDSNTDEGYAIGGKKLLLPNNYNSRTKANIGHITNGVATQTKYIKKYFDSLIKSKFPGKEPASYDILNKARTSFNVSVLIKFPNYSKVISLPVIDTNNGGFATADAKNYPWIDITGQFFVTEAGLNCGSVISKGQRINNEVSGEITLERLQNATRGSAIVALGITGNASNDNSVNARFVLSEDFCTTNGLDPKIFANIPGNFDNSAVNQTNVPDLSGEIEEAVDVATASAKGDIDITKIGGYSDK